MDHAGFISYLHTQAKKHGSWQNLAKSAGCSAMHISDIKNGYRHPSPELLARLGLKATTTYRRIRKDSL